MLNYLSFFFLLQDPEEKGYIYQMYDTVSVSKDFPNAQRKIAVVMCQRWMCCDLVDFCCKIRLVKIQTDIIWQFHEY